VAAAAVSRRAPRSVATVDHAQSGGSDLVPSKPVEQLDHLKLIVEVVLEPQRHFLVASALRECVVALPEQLSNIFEPAPTTVGEKLRADLRHFR
jgi:hypothetical protein